jgi:hypothetical protein
MADTGSSVPLSQDAILRITDETVEEALEMIKDAIEGRLELMKEKKRTKKAS